MKSIIFLFCFYTIVFSQYEDSGIKGKYFPKKHYEYEAIPTFESSKDKLPNPIITDNPEYLKLYWKTWQIAFKNLKQPLDDSPLVSNYIDEAFSPCIFQWDTIFMMMFMKYAHSVFPAIESLDNFYCLQYENGFISRSTYEKDGTSKVYKKWDDMINPPLFAWAEIEYYKISGDVSRFEMIMPSLVKYAEWLEKYRKKENTVHNLFWQTGLGSGMDNTPRSGSGWIDMSAQMLMLYDGMAYMSEKIGKPEMSAEFLKRKNEIDDAINKYMWNDEDGLFYDVDDEGKQVRCKTIASFWPMLAGICSQEQSIKLWKNLLDTKTFWRKIPFPTLAADEKDYRPDGQYWLGGVWAPTNFMVIKGLDNFSFLDWRRSKNFREVAAIASSEYLTGMSEVFKRTGTIWENYAPDLYMRGNISRSDFVGWSGCGPVTLLIENILGIHPDASENTIVWYINRIDRHGIEQLKFGDVNTSLICNKRESVVDECNVTIESNKPYKLVIYKDAESASVYNIESGMNSLIIK